MKDTLLKVLTLLDAPSRRLAVILIAVAGLASLLEAATAGLVFALFTVLQGEGGRMGAVLRAWGADLGDRQTIVATCVVLFLVMVMRTGVTLLAVLLKSTLLMQVFKRVVDGLMRVYTGRPFEAHFKTNATALVHNVVRGSYSVANLSLGSLLDMAADIMVALAVLLMLFSVSPWATLVALVIMGSVSAGVMSLSRRRISRWAKQAENRLVDMQTTATQALQGIKTIKVFGREDAFVTATNRAAADYTGYNRRYMVLAQMPRIVLELLVFGALLGALALSVLLGVPTADIVPTLALLAVAGYRLMPAVVRVATAANNIRYSEPLLTSVTADLAEGRNAVKEMPYGGRGFREAIRLDGVSFTYGGATDVTLDGVTIEIRPGEVVAFAGPSGAGKTTLADIILGLLTPTGGRLRFDSAEMRSFEALPRALFGYVPQDTFVLDDTLRRNIALGLKDGEIDDARIRAALADAALDRFVASLPDGLDTPLGDRGTRLSGGQRQRLGIARALYHDPTILLLDEATSALDSLTEADIAETLGKLRGHKTIILIAHRLSTIRHVDRVYFISNGRVEASGTFSEVVAASPSFRAMVERMEMETSHG